MDVPAVARAVAMTQVGTVPDELPGRRMALDPFAKLLVLLSRAGHHGDETPARAVDIVQVVVGAQLRIGDIQEVRAPGHRPERVPGVDVGPGVAGIAVGHAKLDRHPALTIHGQDEQQLLQIRAVVLRGMLCITYLQ